MEGKSMQLLRGLNFKCIFHALVDPCYFVISYIYISVCVCYVTEAQEGVRMTLDCAQACFISPEKLVVSLKGGELWDLQHSFIHSFQSLYSAPSRNRLRCTLSPATAKKKWLKWFVESRQIILRRSEDLELCNSALQALQAVYPFFWSSPQYNVQRCITFLGQGPQHIIF